jgi:type IV pilus assembly protein PilB
MKLGNTLLQEGKITREQLGVALKEQKRTGELVGRVLNRLGFVTQADVIRGIASQAGVKFVDLETYSIDPAALKLISYEFAVKNKILPLSLKEGRLHIGMGNPLDIVTLDRVRRMTQVQVEAVAAPEDEILKTLDARYQREQGNKEKRIIKD